MEQHESNTPRQMSTIAADLYRLAMRDQFIEQVAKHMAFVAWLDAGCTGVPKWEQISPNVQEAYRAQARKACRLLDNGAKLSLMKASIETTMNWIPGLEPAPNLQDVLLHALMDYDYLAGEEGSRG